MTNNKKTFEASLGELEKIVRELEQGELSLEESLKLFETGVKLSRECRSRLDQAERRIEVLLQDENGNPELQNIEDGDLGDNSPPNINKSLERDDDF